MPNLPAHPDLRRIADSVRVLSPTSYRIERMVEDIGSSSSASDESPVSEGLLKALRNIGAGEPGQPMADLILALQSDVYDFFYSRGPARLPVDEKARRKHVERLSRANSGKGFLEPGWTVVGHAEEGSLIIQKRDLKLWVRPSRLEPARDLESGIECRLRIGKELRRTQFAFYFAIGNAGDVSAGPGDSVVRFYWHLTASASFVLIKSLTGRLNASGVPFSFKVLSSPEAYVRADAGVLYLAKRSFPVVSGLLTEIHEDCRDGLRESVPRMTKPLAPGLGVAEDPGRGLSFGEHRSFLVAIGLWRAFEQKASSSADRTACVAASFREADLDPTRPHLQPDSEDIYELPAVRKPAGTHKSGTRRSASASGHSSRQASREVSFLELAAGLARRLCSQAYWFEGRCNWLGPESDSRHVGDRYRTSVKALGPDVYSGTAGVGLILAHLAALTKEGRFLKTCEGAMKQAFGSLEDERPGIGSVGVFSGRLGVALTGRRVGELLQSSEWIERSEGLFDLALSNLRGGPNLLDVVSGNAGAILGLDGEAGRTREIEQLGQEILEDARKSPEEWCWPNVRAFGEGENWRPLTGFSHGAAGMGLSLLEVFRTTGREEFRQGARKAFAYEDGLFEPEKKNWPDFREAGSDDETRHPVAWCNGAPGIALSRLRALELDPEGKQFYEAAVRAGLETTARVIERATVRLDAHPSLCHGWAGWIDTLLSAARFPGSRERLSMAEEASRSLFERSHYEVWQTGPSLMVGEMGLVYLLLRLHDPASVPPLLLARF